MNYKKEEKNYYCHSSCCNRITGSLHRQIISHTLVAGGSKVEREREANFKAKYEKSVREHAECPPAQEMDTRCQTRAVIVAGEEWMKRKLVRDAAYRGRHKNDMQTRLPKPPTFSSSIY